MEQESSTDYSSPASDFDTSPSTDAPLATTPSQYETSPYQAPQSGMEPVTSGRKTVKIMRVGVLKAALIQGLLGAIGGLIVGLIYGGMIGVMGAIGGAASELGFPAAGGAAIGLVMVVALPIMYGIFGFCAGAITALVANLIFRWVGGLEIETESK